MAERRNVSRLSVRDGDRLLRNACKIDLSIYDDKLPVSTGMQVRNIPNDSVEISIDFTTQGIADVKFLLLYAKEKLSVKLNSAANPAFIMAPPTDLPTGQVIDEDIMLVGAWMLRTEGITSIHITNSAPNSTDLFYLAAGT